MLLTKEQQALFDNTAIVKTLTMNFYKDSPTFLYPSNNLSPGDDVFPGIQSGTTLVKHLGDEDILSGESTLTESISNSAVLKFGTVTANKLVSSIYVDVDVQGLFCELLETAGSVTLPLFYGVVDSVKRKTTANRNVKTITCYDILHSYLDIDVTDWYNSLAFPMTILELRTLLSSTFGLKYAEAVLVNDSLEVGKHELQGVLTARNLLQYICEINCVFANVNRYQQIVFLSLVPFTLLYPSNNLSPGDDVFPGIQSTSQSIYTVDKYKPSDYGEYRTMEISKVCIYDNQNTLLSSFGTGGNIYTIKENILASSMSPVILGQAIQNFYELARKITYVPAAITLSAKPYLEVGDVVQFPIGSGSISSFILQRTLKILQTDKFEAKGNEYHEKSYETESEE